MASSSQPKRYLLMGFNAFFDRPHVEFVESLPATVPVCASCSGVPSEHYTLSCTHVFCSACFEDIVKSRPPSLRCPIDGKSMQTSEAVPKQITGVERVNRLLVRCWNKQRGCVYTGHLADMRRHFLGCAFYEVTCSICSKTMPRLTFSAHFGAVHEEGRTSAGNDDPAGGDDPTRAELTNDHQPEDAVPKRSHRDGEFVRVLSVSSVSLESLVKATASKTTKDIKQHIEARFLELFSGIERVKDLVVEFAGAAKLAVPAKGATERESATSRPRRDIPVKDYAWVVAPYSKLLVERDHVDSPVFFIAPGYQVQLQARVDGIATLELTASVKVHRTDAATDVPRANQMPWPFRRTCQFTLFHNSAHDRDLTNSFTSCDAFKGPAASSSSSNDEMLVSGWLEIGKVEKDVFESQYVKNDTFTIGFCTVSLLE